MEEVKRLVNFIDGQFIECSRHIDSYNPATGKQILKIPDSGSEEVDAALQAAKKAFKLYVSYQFSDRVVCIFVVGRRKVVQILYSGR